MKLIDLVDNELTDKNQAYSSPGSGHTYLPLYETLMKDKKISAKNILEIGVQRGGSIKLWDDYFVNADIYGIDIEIVTNNCVKYLLNKKNIHLIKGDAYNNNFFEKISKDFNIKNIKFDIILDDGPHTLESMKKFINLYLDLLTDDGILIIEDIFYVEWFDILKKEVPNNLLKYVKTYDRRHIANKHNDLVFVINKSI